VSKNNHMAKENVNISTVPVTIRVIEVGNKKMTISVFNQIPEKDFSYESDKDGFLGWVSYKDEKFIIFTRNNILLKHEKEYVSREISSNYNEVIENRWTVRDLDEEDKEERINRYNIAVQNLKNKYRDLLKNENQIYIAV